MDKKNVRKEIYQFFEDISPEKLKSLSFTVTENLTAQDLWQQSHVILAFLTFGKEFETSFLIKKALEEGKKVAVPRIYGKEMKFHYINSLNDNFDVNRWNIREPLSTTPFWLPEEDKTLMVAPGLAFKVSGGRLGRGGGFYDRFLSQFGKSLKTVGLCFEQQIRDDFPVGELDYPLQAVCSDRKLYLV